VLETALFEDLIQRLRLEAVDQQQRFVVRERFELGRDVSERFAVDPSDVQASIDLGSLSGHIRASVDEEVRVLPNVFGTCPSAVFNDSSGTLDTPRT
jgi:hypothetical protein